MMNRTHSNTSKSAAVESDSQRTCTQEDTRGGAKVPLNEGASIPEADDGISELDHVICAEAVACLGRRSVQGELMVTPYGLMFEPSLRDSYVQQHGLMEFQFCIDLRDVKGCSAVMQRSSNASALDHHHHTHGHQVKETGGGNDNSLFDRAEVGDVNEIANKASDGDTSTTSNRISGDDDKDIVKQHTTTTPWLFQVVWASAYVGRSNDSVLYFKVNYPRVEALVERLQALMVRLENDRCRGLSSALANRSTLTSGNPLMSADTFEPMDEDEIVHISRLETKGRDSDGWIAVNSPQSSPGNEGASIRAIDTLLSSSSSKSDGGGEENKEPARPLRRVPEVLPSSSKILSLEQVTDIEEALPERCRGYTWRRAYDFEGDGVSLETLYAKLSGFSDCLLCVQTTHGSLAGAFASAELSMKQSSSFYGTGETFLFSVKQPNMDLEIFPWTGSNELYVSTSSKHLGFGGGGDGFALMLDGGKFVFSWGFFCYVFFFFFSLCICVCLYVRLCVFVCECACLFVGLFVFLFACLRVCLFACLRVCLFACLFSCLLVCVFACLLVCSFACLRVCLFVRLFVYVFKSHAWCSFCHAFVFKLEVCRMSLQVQSV
jgi:hypothetical protein